MFRVWLAALAMLALPAYAEPSAHEKLEQAQKKLEQERAHEKAIAQQRAGLEKELEQSQATLIALAAAVQSNERQLADAGEKLSILNRERAERQAALATRRDALRALVGAAVRLSQTPPEAAVMMPGDFGDAMTAARVLGSLSKSLREALTSLSAQIKELDALAAKVERERSRVAEAEGALNQQRQAMASRVAERQSLETQLSREEEGAHQRMEELSREAKDMQGLLDKLEAARAAERKTAAKGKQRPFSAAKGHMRLPAEGKVVHRFGQALGQNETSKGLMIAAALHASVVAPFDGEVVFTGPFLAYGKIVILRHSDEYHTLLAGFERIDVSPGEFLLEGEPIGAMGEASSEGGLYVELRHKNQPIDPAPWIRDLNH